MKRVLAIWLPNWPVQRLVLQKPEWAGRPLVLHAPSRRGECVVACSAAAARAGVAPGDSLVEAVVALSRQGGQARTCEPHDAAADGAALVELAQWCHRFSPTVGLEDAAAPDTLLLDATNLAPLYGGEGVLIDQLRRALKNRGLVAHVAAADSVGAAWALSHAPGWELAARPGGLCSEIPGGDVFDPDEGRLSTTTKGARNRGRKPLPHISSPMQDLPLAALRLPGEMLATLADLGLVSIGDVLLLDREQLRSRFGPSLLLRIDQFLGAVAEVFAAVDPPEQFVVEQSFEHPIKHSDAIRGSVERLLERLAWWLAARDAGALEIACRLACEDGTATELTFGVFQPTASAQRLLEIADLQLERLRLAAPVQGIELCVLRHARLEQRQGTLFESQRTLDGSLQLTGLIDRLSGRLGRQAVVRCRIVSDAQPELAYREEPLVGSAPPSAPGGRSRMHSRRS
ncbi:MAG TPA: DNA polymerase Y family protein, partial [Lacipirellulaceae bacterium]|nr:DNA polymerase Y family protein [Lacipirellulaceae bacterium]